MRNVFRQIGCLLTNLKKYFMGFFSIFKKSNDYFLKGYEIV